METKHFIQGPEEFLIKIGTEKNEDFKKNFDTLYDKYKLKCEEQGLVEMVFKTEKKNKFLHIYGKRIIK